MGASGAICGNPDFKLLVAERTRFSWMLTTLTLVVNFGFIGLIAFDKQLLALKVGGTAPSDCSSASSSSSSHSY